MKLFFRISVLVLCILMSLSSFADDKKDRISVEKIDWSANNESLKTIVSTSADPNKIYLYAKGHNKFVTVGGRYGAQPILAEVGMYFYVEKVADDTKDRYYIHSWVNNPTTSQGTGNADYLGVEPLMDTDQRIFLTDPKNESMKSIYLYVDRGINNTHDDGTYPSPERIKWHIKSVDTKNGYQIYSTWSDNQKYSDNAVRDYYLSYYADPNSQKKFLVVTTDKSQAETFYFIKKEDYRKVINSQNKKYINVSGLVRDARFERNNKGIDGTFDLKGDYNTKSKNNVWQFRYDRNYDTYVFPNKQDNVEDLAYMTAWVGCEGSSENQKGNYLIQKITKLKPGLYRVNCQGFYFNPNDKNDKDNTSFVFASQDYTDISNQTALKTIESDDWDSMQNMTYHGAEVTADGKNGYVDYSIKHCVNAGKIFAESNPYEDKDVDSRKYDNSVAVLVKADKGSTTGTLYIGAGKRANEGGYAFFDNFQLFYMGDRQWYLDATNTSTDDFTTTKSTDDYDTPSGINRNPAGPDQYKFPVTYNIRRYFHVGKWESLILPCTLTGDQVKQTFGGDQGVQLSVFDRVEKNCVYFKTVNLDTDSIVAGKPYIIKVGKEADIKTKADEYTFPFGNKTTVKVNGPIYQVKGVVPPTFKGNGVTIEDKTSAGDKVQFHGFYYDPGAAPRNAYVVNNGNMYHLSSDWNSFVGTSWYITITDAQGNAKALSFSFDGDSSTTAIENVTRQEDAAVQNDGFVYNLSGQRVGTRNNMSNLSSGIYIVAGKKVVVK
ncbi:hypothetical protein KUA50_000060 [Segatella hominis]|uniref:hypothetical protein n=1 Tax=Segatella hominis TaxID=2518605 RepID=UPI001C46B504|nr:hypothetical protein [Segatella hominis]WOZ81395.1 hypothetical protein KUA50_000060 [Segatella hominis]